MAGKIKLVKQYEMALDLRKGGISCSAIAKQLEVHIDSVYKWTKHIKLTQEQLDARNKHQYKLDLFKYPNDLTYYVLGAFISDGNVARNMAMASLASSDYDWLVQIRSIICPTKPIQKKSNANCWDMVIQKKFIVQWLNDHECVPNKSLTVKFPDVPEQYLPDFIRGVIDGDGTICVVNDSASNVKKFSVSMATGSEIFAQQMRDAIRSLGIKAEYRTTEYKNYSIMGKPPKDYHDSYRIYATSSAEAVKLCDIIYKDSRMHLERKYLNFQNYLKIKANELATNIQVKHPIEDAQWVLEMLKTRTYKEVGKMIGLDSSNVLRQLQKLGLHTPRKKTRR